MPIQSISRTQSLIIIVSTIVISHVMQFLPLSLSWRAGAALLLAGLLPGVLLVHWLISSTLQGYHPVERILYSLGAGYGIMVLVMLTLSYLPGIGSTGIAQWQTFLAFDVVIAILVYLIIKRPTTNLPLSDMTISYPTNKESGHEALESEAIDSALPSLFKKNGWIIAGIIILVIFGGFFRFADLSYSEFQGDEARAVLRAAETIQGYRDALLGHKKGPSEILIPAVVYSLTGQIDESSARLPFAIANLAGLVAIFLLGLRLFGPVAGWATAMLLAVDGYFIGFSHIVQYQSIVFLTVVLTVLILHRLVVRPVQIVRYLILAAFILASGLLAHYEAALVLFPALFLLGYLNNKIGWRKLLTHLPLPFAVGATILGLFYIPFVLNPNFAITIAYITVNRIGVNRESGGFPYNNLVNVFERTALYSSTYYILFLIGLTVLGIALLYWQNFARPWRAIAVATWLAGILLTFWQPDWGILPGLPQGRNDYTWLFFAIAMMVAWILPNVPWQERMVWIWFGAPMVLSLFFIATPNTHVYGFFIGWSLVAGLVIQRIWIWLRNSLNLTAARIIAIPIAVALILLFGTYEYWYFVHNQVEILRTWRDNRPAGYWVPYTMPTNMSIFGFPFRNGWKAVGALYADGALNGTFTTNGRDAVADWYTRGQAYCPRDHRYYIYSDAVEPAEVERLTQLRKELEAEYALWGTIQVNGEDRLRIYERSRATGELQNQPLPEQIAPLQIDLEDYEGYFDKSLSGPFFERGGPIGEALAERAIGHPLDFWFGAKPEDPSRAIRLRGFTLQHQEVAPGAEVQLTLYWEAHQPTDKPFSVTTQLINPDDFTKVGQNDGEPVCNTRPTNYWLPGELFADRYRIPIAPDANAGTYQVLIGIYDRETGEQLEAFTADGNSAGPGLGISQIDVVAP